MQGVAKNVIYIISDGAGEGAYDAAGFYNGNKGSEVVRGPGWASTWQSVYPLRTDTGPIPGSAGLAQDPATVYSSAKAWDTTPTGGTPLEFQGYVYHDTTAPDSSGTASASMTGVKTYNNALNVNGNGTAVSTYAELAFGHGKTTGVVTTVQISDATPAAFSGAHNVSRLNRTQITDSMLSAPYLNVIMGTGNPDYDDNQNAQPAPDHTWISDGTWNNLKGNSGTGFDADWQLIQDKAEFDHLAEGTLTPTKKTSGVIKALNGKQAYRGADGLGDSDYMSLPYATPLNTNVPMLATEVAGALNVLTKNPKGFFLGVEQGETDRAEHANNLGANDRVAHRALQTVQWLQDYLDTNAGSVDLPNWNNTLVVVTADHDHQLYGVDSDTHPFSDLTGNGVGQLPNALFQTHEHSNRLVPIFARGPGSELLAAYADQVDAYTDVQGSDVRRGRLHGSDRTV